MNQRFLLALALTAIVIVLTPQLFPRTPTLQPADSARSSVVQSTPSTQPQAGISATPAPAQNSSTKLPNTPAGDTTAVQTVRARYVFTSAGAAPLGITLDSYPSRRAGIHRGADLV